MAGKFVLKKGPSGKYHFNLLAANGQVIATSETYERKQSALDGIESVRRPRREAPPASPSPFIAAAQQADDLWDMP